MIFVLVSLAKLAPSIPIFGNRHRKKACLLTNTRMQFTHEENVSMNATSWRNLLQRGATRMKQTDVKQP
jgi:hypothetical protein